MAQIIGCIGTSHVPTIGVAYDKGKQQDPAWKPLFDGYVPIANWLKEQRVDAMVMVYNDHCSSFFFDFYPTFALGIGESFPVADEGAGMRPLPPIKGDVDLQIHMHRLPQGRWLGLETVQQIGKDGIGLTSSVLHDVHGPFGHSEQLLTVRKLPQK